MGIGWDFAETIVREHVFLPITGDVVFIGRQGVYLTPRDALELVRGYKVAASDTEDQIALDRTTINRLKSHPAESIISDIGFLSLLNGERTVRALDRSDYEGAEIIHDLSAPVPDGLANSADFIIDGSTLDNVFDPVRALTNYATMLRPGGRLLAINAWTPHATAYVLASPQWFLDYFVTNAWADCKIYLIAYVRSGDIFNAFYCDPNCMMERGRPSMNFVAPCEMATVLFAQKGPDSTTHRLPTQRDYRSAEDWKIYRRNLAAFSLVPRPHLVRSRHPLAIEKVPPGHLYMDSYWHAIDPEFEHMKMQSAATQPFRTWAFNRSPPWLRTIKRAVFGVSNPDRPVKLP